MALRPKPFSRRCKGLVWTPSAIFAGGAACAGENTPSPIVDGYSSGSAKGAYGYLHLRELAPAPALRQRQFAADKAEGTTKRKRAALSELFIKAYREEHLAGFDSHRFAEQLGPEARTVALFCVEREPAACHRSLLAERLRQDLGVEVVHLKPD